MPDDIPLGQRFAGATAVVTGAASGIGRATAIRIAREGGRVIALDIADGGGVSTVDEIEAMGGAAESIAVDVTDREQVERAIARCDARGGFDVLVNSAGTAFYGHFGHVAAQDVRHVMDVNFFGTYWTTQFALDRLLATRGAIVNVGSVAALRGVAYLTAYSASKGAIVAFTKSLAVEFGGRGLRVNCVCPGPVDTPMAHGLELPDGADAELVGRSRNLYGRSASADEIAATIAFLASPDATHMNGSIVTIDAGLTA